MCAIDALYVAAFTLNTVSAYLHLCCDGDPKLGLFNVFIIILLIVEAV